MDSRNAPAAWSATLARRNSAKAPAFGFNGGERVSFFDILSNL
jgi:hypothetical protein